jgi:hypothetical protein
MIQYVALGSAVLVIAVRFAFASPSVYRQLDGVAMVLFGIGAFAGGDRWRFTDSRHLFARTAGWIITSVFAGALIIGGCLEFSGR